MARRTARSFLPLRHTPNCTTPCKGGSGGVAAELMLFFSISVVPGSAPPVCTSLPCVQYLQAFIPSSLLSAFFYQE